MQLCKDELQRLGWTLQPVGRIGHGVGIESTEYPSVALGETTPMEEGMIFACNPNFVTEHGFFNNEENLVVTSDGFEILSHPEASVEPPQIH
jgi:Xaa-Pro aminopeptidase